MVVLLAIFYTKFLFSLPVPVRVGLLLAGFLYLSGALGLEALGGSYATQHGQEDLLYQYYVTGKELLEFSGLLLHTLLTQLRNALQRSRYIPLGRNETQGNNQLSNVI